MLVEGARFVVGLVEDCYASNGCFVGGTTELVEFERGGYVKTKSFPWMAKRISMVSSLVFCVQVRDRKAA